MEFKIFSRRGINFSKSRSFATFTDLELHIGDLYRKMLAQHDFACLRSYRYILSNLESADWGRIVGRIP